MAAPEETRLLTPEEYLAGELVSPLKHEYVRGQVFAMSGVSDAHNDVAGNLHSSLRTHLRGSPCRAYIADVKLRVEAANAYFYPDVFVTCAPEDREDPLVKRHAVLVAEVLSESTAPYDRSEQFDDYQRLPDLREYLLIDSREQKVILYRRRAGEIWEFESLSPGGTVRLESLDLTLSVAALYEDTAVPLTRPRNGRGGAEVP